MLTNPNLDKDYRLQKLLRNYNKFGNIVVGVDFDFTLVDAVTKTIYKGFIVNQSTIDLIDLINSKTLLGQFDNNYNMIANGAIPTTYLSSTKFNFVDNTGSGQNFNLGRSYLAPTAIPALKIMNGVTYKPEMYGILPGLLIKYILNQSHVSENLKNSIVQLLIELGIDEGLVNSAIKSIVPIDFDLTKYNSTFDSNSGILSIQNQTPAKLKSRYKKSINNPANEQLYIYLPRYLNRWAIENPYYGLNFVIGDPGLIYGGSISSVSYPATSKVIDGEVVDNTTSRVRQQDYTAVSIGITGNGKTDLEYDNLDVIDYIDSFTAMVKIPNKF